MTHLDRETLQQFLRDELGEEANAAAAAHIESCHECESLLESLAHEASPPQLSSVYHVESNSTTAATDSHERVGGSAMHKSISAHTGSRFAWRAFFFGVLTVFVPMILLVLLLFGGMVLSWTESRAQRAQAVLSHDQAERIATTAQEAIRRRSPIISSEPYFTEASEAVIEESTAPMQIPDTPEPLSPAKPMMGSLIGGSGSQANNEQRIVELMEQLVEQQQRQQQFLEQQAQYNEEMLHLLRKSLEAASNNVERVGGGGSEVLPAESAVPLDTLDAGDAASEPQPEKPESRPF